MSDMVAGPVAVSTCQTCWRCRERLKSVQLVNDLDAARGRMDLAARAAGLEAGLAEEALAVSESPVDEVIACGPRPNDVIFRLSD